MTVTTIDLNCDLGEGSGHDAELMRFITSANVACGGHAGERAGILATIDLALGAGVSIGAHPSYEDREGFGRRDVPIAAEGIAELMRRQLGGFLDLAGTRAARVAHVKPHGALYNRAARDRSAARAVAEAVRSVDPRLILVGLAGSELLGAGRAAGLRVASEGFADRRYEPDGSLVPRSRARALIDDEDEAEAQVLAMARDGRIRAIDGSELAFAADTVCLHGDGTRAVAFARRIHGALAAAGIRLAPLSVAIGGGPAGGRPS